MPEQGILKILEAVHPSYTVNLQDWLLFRDVTKANWGTELKKKYLIKGRIEPESEFDLRSSMSEFLGVSGPCIRRIMSSLFKDMPARKAIPVKLQSMQDKADRRGKSIDIFMRDVVDSGLVYGSCHILVDKREAPDNVKASGVFNEKELRELGLDRPFLVKYTPLEMWDWETDDDGKYLWVKFVTNVTQKNTLMSDRVGYRYYRIFDRNAWRVYRVVLTATGVDDKTVELVSEGRHDLGVVPVVTFIPLSEIEPAIGSSFIKNSSRADIKCFRRDSDLQWDLYIHSHPILKIWTKDTLKEIGVGGSVYLPLKPAIGEDAQEDASYIDIPESAFDGNFRAIQNARLEAFEQIGIDPMGVIKNDDGAGQTSGVSRAWSFSTSEARLLANIADNAEQAEYEIFEIAAKWEDIDSSRIRVRYPDNFDLVSAIDLIKAYTMIGQAVKSKRFHTEMLGKIASHMVGDIGSEGFDEIVKQIDRAGIPEIIPTGAPQETRINRNRNNKRLADSGIGTENPDGPEPVSRRKIAEPRSKA